MQNANYVRRCMNITLDNSRRLRVCTRGILLICLVQGGHLHVVGDRLDSMIADEEGVGRWTGRTLTAVLALDEAVGDSQDGVDDYGVDTLGDLVLRGEGESDGE